MSERRKKKGGRRVRSLVLSTFSHAHGSQGLSLRQPHLPLDACTQALLLTRLLIIDSSYYRGAYLFVLIVPGLLVPTTTSCYFPILHCSTFPLRDVTLYTYERYLASRANATCSACICMTTVRAVSRTF